MLFGEPSSTEPIFSKQLFSPEKTAGRASKSEAKIPSKDTK